MTSEPPRTLYRLVQSDPPTRRDFLSHADLDMIPRRPLTARQAEQWRGISMFGTRETAARRARLSPQLGAHVAELSIPSDSPAHVEQTGRDADHYTVWAPPEDLASWLVSVTPVEGLH